jgi:multidrug efflux system membrane fusion protein
MIKGRLKKIVLLGLLFVLTIIGLRYFSEKHEAVADDVQGEMPQAMPVTVEIIDVKTIQIWKKYSAILESVGYAEIRPQVTGRIIDVRFQDGQMVKKGEVIYVIDPRTYEASLDQAKAELNAALNNASLSRKEYERAKELISSKAISQKILDERHSALSVAENLVKRWKATVQSAEINVDYAYIKAPISGKMSRAEVKVGNVVQAGPNAPLLTSIVTTGGVYADFEVDEKTYSLIAGNDPKNIPVKLTIGSHSDEHQGVVDSFDNRINPSTGTIRTRALFKDTNSALLPGMVATIQMGQANAEEVITVPEMALGTDQDRKFVYIVNDENIVTYRAVEAGSTVDGRRVIKSGLDVGDKVIIEGLIKIRPGMPVSPHSKDQET